MNKHESKITFVDREILICLFVREYLKGFHKRKLERRERAQKELEDEIKSDLKNLRQKVSCYFSEHENTSSFI